jgi:penicillin-binding protein 2
MPLVEDRRKLSMRLMVLQYVIAVVFSVLAVSFWVFQVVQHAKFAEMAENNHQRTLALRAPRGLVFDRDGRVLVENRHSYNIAIVREHTKDLPRTIRLLASVLGEDEARIRDIVDRHRREPTYRPVTIVPDATLAQVAAVTARRLDFELPDVVIEQVPTRRYPATLAAHLFGYVGEVNDTQVAEDDTLKSGDIVGQSGIEKIYNAFLMGEDGARRVVVNSVGREIRTIEEEPATEGKRLALTVDLDLQTALEDGFKWSGFNGASVIMDPHTGEVLAFTSVPAYDPNAFAAGPVDRATWASLNSVDLKPLQFREIQGRYSPGSTFKLAVAAAAIEEGIVSPDFRVYCPGHATFFGRSFQCSLPDGRGHGTLDMREAIEHSCNVYFYTVGNMVGIDKIHKWATLLGLGEKTGIDLPNEVQGLVPSPEWKRERFKEKWYAGETISVSIGQGAVALTPVSMAVYISTIANGGTRLTPHLLKAVDDGSGSGWKDVPPPAPRSTVKLKPETSEALRDALWMVVNRNGTGGLARIAGRDVSGKTGTAQVISLEGAKSAKGRTDKDLRDNGWFVFFAPRDNPQISGAVFVEHGGHGGVTAAPIAKHVLETFFAKSEGRPLPPPPTRDEHHPEPKDPRPRPAAATAN